MPMLLFQEEKLAIFQSYIGKEVIVVDQNGKQSLQEI